MQSLGAISLHLDIFVCIELDIGDCLYRLVATEYEKWHV